MTIDKSIFRERAIEKYMRRREIHVILRLVSPPMFLFLWGLILLTVCGGVVVWSIQVPIFAQGKGLVIQQPGSQKAAAGQQAPQQAIVLLLLPPDQQVHLKVGQSVVITLEGTTTSFTSTIEKVQAGVMSPNDIRTQFNVPTPLSQAIAGPSVVAIAPVQPASLAHTYLGSECESQVKIGSQSALALVPVVNNFANYLNSARNLFDTLRKDVSNLL